MKNNIKTKINVALAITMVTSGVAFAATEVYNDITIPGTVTSTDKITDTWGNSINTAIKQLADKTKFLTDAAIEFSNYITLKDGNVGIGTNTPEETLHVNGGVTINPNTIQLGSPTPVNSERLFNFSWPNNNDGSTETDDADPNNSITGEVAPWYMYFGRAAYGGNLHFKPRNLDGSYKNSGVTFTTDGTMTTASDERFKDNIETLSGLEIVQQLRGVSFNWKDSGKKDMGVIAQEVEKVFPNLVTTDLDGYKSVSYTSLIAPLIEATKTQQTTIESQQVQIDALIERIEALEAK